ncbi:hypothetical protein [Streptomyces sp. NPDC000878]
MPPPARWRAGRVAVLRSGRAVVLERAVRRDLLQGGEVARPVQGGQVREADVEELVRAQGGAMGPQDEPQGVQPLLGPALRQADLGVLTRGGEVRTRPTARVCWGYAAGSPRRPGR